MNTYMHTCIYAVVHTHLHRLGEAVDLHESEKRKQQQIQIELNAKIAEHTDLVAAVAKVACLFA